MSLDSYIFQHDYQAKCVTLTTSEETLLTMLMRMTFRPYQGEIETHSRSKMEVHLFGGLQLVLGDKGSFVSKLIWMSLK